MKLWITLTLACCTRGASLHQKRTTQYESGHVQMHEHRNSSGDLLAIWVNSDSSLEAPAEVLERAGLQLLRLPVLNQSVTKSFIKNASLRVKIIKEFDVEFDLYARRYTYLTREVALTLSHIEAVRTAYLRGAHKALVLEDGFTPTEKFLLNWRRLVAVAPPGWQVLQLHCWNPSVIKMSGRVFGDGFTQWMGNHYSTGAYLINRKGMKTLLDVSNAEKGPITLPGRVIVSDEFVYFHTTSYTVLDPMISVRHTAGEVGLPESHSMYEELLQKRLPMPFLNLTQPLASARRTLVISVTLIAHLNDTEVAAEKIFLNVAELSRHTKFRFALLVLIRDEYMRQPVVNAFKPRHHLYGTSFNLAIKVVQERFNKFRFVKKFVPEMENYDYVLLADNDIFFPGYPWEELFRRIREAGSVITGTARETKAESLLQNLGRHIRTPFKIFDGTAWRQQGRDDIDYVYTQFIEQYFTVLDGRFAQWYFAHILIDAAWTTDTGAPTPSDWGPDVCWCGAAADWLKENVHITPLNEPCAFVTLIIAHADSKQIGVLFGPEDIAQRKRMSGLFPKWWNFGVTWKLPLESQKWFSVNVTCSPWENTTTTPGHLPLPDRRCTVIKADSSKNNSRY